MIRDLIRESERNIERERGKIVKGKGERGKWVFKEGEWRWEQSKAVRREVAGKRKKGKKKKRKRKEDK